MVRRMKQRWANLQEGDSGDELFEVEGLFS